jgi:hypothetical protein
MGLAWMAQFSTNNDKWCVPSFFSCVWLAEVYQFRWSFSQDQLLVLLMSCVGLLFVIGSTPSLMPIFWVWFGIFTMFLYFQQYKIWFLCLDLLLYWSIHFLKFLPKSWILYIPHILIRCISFPCLLKHLNSCSDFWHM